jgi:hypothetical protein
MQVEGALLGTRHQAFATKSYAAGTINLLWLITLAYPEAQPPTEKWRFSLSTNVDATLSVAFETSRLRHDQGIYEIIGWGPREFDPIYLIPPLGGV